MSRFHIAILVFIALIFLDDATAIAAPKADLWQRWEKNDPDSTTQVDHQLWTQFLMKYLIVDHPSGINRMRYADVSLKDRQLLDIYLERLQAVEVTGLNRNEQFAYWINLYNALTVKIVLDHYPVESILDIDISPGFFSNGPWDAKLVDIEGEKISLNDIEHRILRPIWKDNRIHYAVNCASISCPNVQGIPFTADNSRQLLDKAARAYVNHPRCVHFKDRKKVEISSIYKWYQEDFGNSEAGVLKHLQKYAEPVLAEKLRGFNGRIDYEYDWRLNRP